MVATVAEVLSLPQAKSFLRITTDEHDSELPPFIAAAVGALADGRDEVLVDTVVTERCAANRYGEVLLSKGPVATVESVAAVDGTRTWDAAALAVPQSGVLAAATGAPLAGPVTVVYRAGMADVPERYRMAVKMLLGRLWSTQRGTKGAPRVGGQPDLKQEAMRLVTPEIRGLIGDALPGIA